MSNVRGLRAAADFMQKASGVDPTWLREAADEIERLREQLANVTKALRAVVRDINDYERINHLAPNPGRMECWDSVAYAKRLLLTDDTRTE